MRIQNLTRTVKQQIATKLDQLSVRYPFLDEEGELQYLKDLIFSLGELYEAEAESKTHDIKE